MTKARQPKTACPHCGHWYSVVVGGASTDRGYLRYRKCLSCRQNFNSTERTNPLDPERHPPQHLVSKRPPTEPPSTS